MNEKNCFLIVNAQKDFCDKNGSFYIPGADKGVKKISKIIDTYCGRIDKIYISFEIHSEYCLFFPSWFMPLIPTGEEKLKQFSIIRPIDLVDGTLTTFAPEVLRDTIDYLKYLETINQELTLLPEHCLHGSSTVECINESIKRYDKGNFGHVSYLRIGQNQFTDFESSFKYDLEELDNIKEFDNILIAGQIGSLNIAKTILNMVDVNNKFTKKIIWINDLIYSPDYCEHSEFIELINDLNIKIIKSKEIGTIL